MKKPFKILGVAVLVLLVIFLGLGLTQPKEVTIVRSTIIKAPQNTVFEQIRRFKNWPNWSPWVEIEPNVKLTYEGNDGQVGSSYTWLGDETGSGKMTNMGMANGQLNFDLMFIKPWKGKADGFLKTETLPTNETKVTWSMTLHSSFPMNALHFFTEKMVGKDFVSGLELLKNYTEAHPNIELSINSVEEKDLPYTTFATLRKKIKWTEIQSFSTTAFATLAAASGDRIKGMPYTFYYTWEDSIQSTDMAPAFAVMGTEPVDGATMVTMPSAHSFTLTYKGGYANMGKAHQILGQYLEHKGRRLNVILEEYLTGPANEPDSNKWVTNINYIVQ